VSGLFHPSEQTVVQVCMRSIHEAASESAQSAPPASVIGQIKCVLIQYETGWYRVMNVPAGSAGFFIGGNRI